jgi:hypothetical protein
VLATVAPNPDDLTSVDEVVKSFAPDRQPRHLFEQVRGLVCFGIWQMDLPEGVTAETISAEKLAERMKQRWSELREVLTHVFDFLYFYGKDAQSYIRAVWVSWDVIPNIQNRIQDYITRSLCALQANNLKRGAEGFQITVDQLIRFLNATKEEFPGSIYIPQAVTDLSSRVEYYKRRLQHRTQLIRFVRYFLYSPKIERLLLREPALIAGDGGTYDLPQVEFSAKRPVNPLRFLTEFSGEKKGDYLRSAWMLTQLAFIQKP